jgi:pimeloyl-ACP methyl ester carboxylesterase
MNSIWVSDEGRAAVHARYAEMLGRWPIPVEQRRVPTREGETFILVCGGVAAPPVLLLQGSGANVAMWIREIAAWAEQFRVYAVDLIGEPGFSAPSRPELSSEAYAAWLDDVMEALGLRYSSVVGVSLGGWMALDYAIRRPARVDKLVVVSPSGVGRQKSSFVFKAAALMFLGRWGRRKAMALAVGPMSGPPHPADREIGKLALLIAKHFRHRRGKVPPFEDEALRRLTIPVLAIVGAQDALLDSHATRRRLEQCVPHATIRVLPHTGHVVRDQTAVILDFLRAG